MVLDVRPSAIIESQKSIDRFCPSVQQLRKPLQINWLETCGHSRTAMEADGEFGWISLDTGGVFQFNWCVTSVLE